MHFFQVQKSGIGLEFDFVYDTFRKFVYLSKSNGKSIAN